MLIWGRLPFATFERILFGQLNQVVLSYQRIVFTGLLLCNFLQGDLCLTYHIQAPCTKGRNVRIIGIGLY